MGIEKRRAAKRKRQREYQRSDRGKAVALKYRMSEKGKAFKQKYKMNGKPRNWQRDYKKTDKGRTTEHKYKISEKNRKYNREYYQKNKLRTRAAGMIYNAIKCGKIERCPCIVCGSLNVQGHHPNYEKPLCVIWLCSEHHSQLHNKIYWNTNDQHKFEMLIDREIHNLEHQSLGGL